MSKKGMIKLVALLMAAAMLLTACSGGKDKSQQESGDKSGAGAGGEGEDIYTEVGTYPIVKDKITLSVFQRQLPHIVDYETNDFTKYLEEKTNINFDFITVPTDAITEKINLMMTSDDLPDMFMYDTPDPSKFGVDEGMLVDLIPYIEKYMPNYKKAMEEYPEIKGMTTSTDGKIYALAGINDCFHCQYSQKMWVNTMWLDKMGVKMPETTEDFYNICKKYKEINPDGIPLIGSIDSWNTDPTCFITNAFILDPGAVNAAMPVKVIETEGKIDTIVNKGEYKEALKYLNKLYSEDLIYEGTFTQKNEQLRQIALDEKMPILFFAGGANVNVLNAALAPEIYKNYEAVTPLTGPNGVKQSTFFKYFPIQTQRFAITTECKYPEAAARVADFFFTTEGQLLSTYGKKGTDWDVADEGKLGIDGSPAKYKVHSFYSDEPQNVDWQDAGIPYLTSEFRLGEQLADGIEDKIKTQAGLELFLFRETKEKYMPYASKEANVVPNLLFLAEESQRLQTLAVELQKYMEESRIAFITGKMNLDKDWDTYVKNLDKMGLGTYLEIQQKAYDRQFK